LAASCRTHPISPISAVRGGKRPRRWDTVICGPPEVATILWAELEPEVAENTVSYTMS